MDFFELIEKRYSVRAYKPDEVEKEKLDKILEAARISPTAANRQAFKLIVAGTRGREEELKRIYGRDWFVQAPYILCVCYIKDRAWVRRDGKAYGDVDAAIVMDHIILAATALGLGTCWVGAFNEEAARKVLELDDSLEPVAFTPIGYGQESQPKKMRLPVEELVVYK